MTEISKPRRVKLFCPLLNKIEALMVWEEQKVDLGSIARVFGLDPSALKLNGHFLSRGIDLVASSVTWKSLLNYFNSKGLCVGMDDKGGVVVDGKLSKIGTKRAQDPQTSASGNWHRDEPADCKSSQPESVTLLTNKKLKESNSDCVKGCQVTQCKGNSLKRKQLLEDLRLLKKLRINEGGSDFEGRGHDDAGAAMTSQFKCSFMSSNMKRTREDEVIVAVPCKRIR